MNNTLILIIFLPLSGSFITALFGKLLGPRKSAIVATSTSFFSLLNSLFLLYKLIFLIPPIHGRTRLITVYSEMFTLTLTLNWDSVFVDIVTSFAYIIVTFMTFYVQLSVFEHNPHDSHLPRVMSQLSFITFLMLVRITFI